MSGKKPLLLGIGNILLSDEAIGVRVIEECEKDSRFANIDIIDGGTAGMELLDEIASRPLVVIIDAIRSREEPGTIHLFKDEQVPRFFSQKLSPHQLGLSDVLSALVMTEEIPERLFLVGIVPETIEPGIGMSNIITEKIDAVLSHIVDIFSKTGVQLA